MGYPADVKIPPPAPLQRAVYRGFWNCRAFGTLSPWSRVENMAAIHFVTGDRR